MAWYPVSPGQPVIEAAWTIQDRFGLTWWDALAVAAAQTLGCTYLLTEDLTHGQMLDGVQVIDPFQVGP
jgi:predicted nucleic acid-binding protein